MSIFALSIVLLGAGSALAVEQLSMGTSSVGGFFYNIGAPVAQCINKALPEVNVTAEFTEGSTENLRLIQKKKMQLAVISPMVGYFAGKWHQHVQEKRARQFESGRAPAAQRQCLDDAQKEQDHQNHSGFQGTQCGASAPAGSASCQGCNWRITGSISKKDIKPFFPATGELATLLKDGKIDVSFLTEGLAKMVTATHEIKMISWDEKDLEAYINEKPYFGSVHLQAQPL